MASMFWGLKMEPGKRYSTTVDKSFHISMATIDAQSVNSDNDIISVILEEGGGGIFHLTNLRRKDHLFSNLDLNFMTGDKITLFCKGQGVIHLSGYMVPEEDDFSTTALDDEAEEEEEEIDDDDNSEDIDESIITSIKGNLSKNEKKAVGMKRKQENEKSKKAKKKKTDLMAGKSEDSDEESDDEEDGNEMVTGIEELDSDDEEAEFEEDEDDDEEEDEDDDEEEDEKILTKKQKNQQKTQANLQQQQNQKGKKKQNVTTPNKTPNGTASPQQKGGKKDEGKKNVDGKGQQNQNKNQGQNQEATLTGGVKVKDIRPGSGQICKPGKQAVVYYSGRLKSNGKVFDSVLQGSGFKFRVGQGEVIKGWDVGVVGMKVGGKRVITCPPQVAYGQKGAPPQIPPNSTLVFEVELKSVN